MSPHCKQRPINLGSDTAGLCHRHLFNPRPLYLKLILAVGFAVSSCKSPSDLVAT